MKFDHGSGEGAIVGDDGARYGFTAADLGAGRLPEEGQRVDFVPGHHRQAQEVIVLQGEASRPAPARGYFDLGRVIQRTFNSVGQNWAVFLGASLILVGIPSVISALGQSTLLTAQSMSGLGFMLTGTVLYFVGLFLLQGMVVKAAVNGFHGKSTPFGEAFGVGVRMFLPLLGLAIVAGIGMTLGYILLIVPGIILTVLWSVAAPAVVVEKRDVLESLQRSRDLTRGNRWPVFGLLVIYVVLSWLIGLLVSGLSVAAGGSFMAGTSNLWVNLIAGPVVNVLSGVVASAGAAALYYELRVAKEGAGAEELAAVFD